MTKELGKISGVKFGYCGYQEMMFGLDLTFEGKGWGVGKTIAHSWSLDLEVNKHTNWTESERDAGFAKTMREINKIMHKAKVSDVTKLKGIPVEVTFENNTIKDWRILEEVL